MSDAFTHLPMTGLVIALAAVALVTLLIAPRVRTANGFFRGFADAGQPPGVLTLTLSQVTTWIFARSLLNAAILGYFFGIAGVLAYTAYYGSFVTGWLIIDRLRFRYGASNLQGFMKAQYGGVGTFCLNGLLALRLVSEVFANLLVVGIVFGAAGSAGNTTAMLSVAALTLVYSLTGGLRASLRTDVLQMVLLIGLLAALVVVMLLHPLFDPGALAVSSPGIDNPGWILLAVAGLQVLSYPMHDPVMMDRGFLADRRTTRRSFLHAFWLSAVCILAFGLLGVFAGLHRLEGETVLLTLDRLMGTPVMFLLAVALVLSAASTLDSTFSSAAKLSIADMGLARTTPRNGRIAMLLFCLGGLLLVLFGTDDLFAAVAVSGTASLALTPVIAFSLLAGWRLSRASLLVSFALAFTGAVVYFLETSGHIDLLTGLEHDYSKLLAITVTILVLATAAAWLGRQGRMEVLK
ncbi:sodium:solute symporter family transporter [Alkalilimnicola ehrlichii]|uniref:sodium:solute symporter family transporter n=1 Tax=Alkalilimnicola ehrlichii TaxID=351052 RepID=UPI003BA2ACCF